MELLRPPDELSHDHEDPSEGPLGFIGVVSPMNTLGFAPFSDLGLVYREGLVLTSAALYQVAFSRLQQKIVEDLLATPFGHWSSNGDARVIGRDRIARVTLSRQFVVGHRLTLSLHGQPTCRLIVQQGRIPEIRRCLTLLAADRFVDHTRGA